MLTIRRADPADLHTVISLIRALAEYEKMLDQVCIDEARMKDELFGDSSVVQTLIAEWNDEPVGFSLYFYNFSTFLGKRGIYIEDIYVQPEARGKKIGFRLLQHIVTQAIAENCGRVEWQVLDWNEPSIKFYESLGAVHKKEWDNYQLTGDALKALAGNAEPAKAGA